MNMNDRIHWSIESWGSEYPPENAEEIIDRANAMIDAYAETHDEDAAEEYSNRLWETYCTTGALTTD